MTTSEIRRCAAGLAAVVCLLVLPPAGRCADVDTNTFPSTIRQVAASARPARWAQPVDKKGLPNFHKVSDTLYRGAQPTAEGFRQLEAMGIKTVVNLRAFHSDKDEMKGSGLAYEAIPMKTWHPDVPDIVRFLAVVTDTNRTPVFVHCQHGADRTGTLNAIYRIVVCNWSKEDAIEEMTKGDYGFHSIWTNLIDFINKLDIEAVRKQLAGTKQPGKPPTP